MLRPDALILALSHRGAGAIAADIVLLYQLMVQRIEILHRGQPVNRNLGCRAFAGGLTA
jgi:hypothetical protein